MRAEEPKGIAENLFTSDGAISALLRSHDWAQTPLGSIETWSESLKTSVQILLTELDSVNPQEKTQVESALVERARAEMALRESEAKYRTLFESIDEGFCICEMLFDQNGRPQDYRFLQVNSVFEQLTGLKEATGKTARELVPNLEAFWIEQYGKVVQTGEPIRFEQQSIALNRWFDVNAFRMGEPQNHQFVILFANIDERKQAEQERERFYAIGSDLQVITGSNGYFRWVSPTFERVLGWMAEEMIAHPWTDFVHPDDIPESVAETDSLFSGNETFRFENRYRHKDGSYRWFRWNAQPYPEEQVIYGAAIDITSRVRTEDERKQAEATLRESEELKRRILESITDAFFAVDENWRFTYVNQTAQTLVDRRADDLIGKVFWEEFPGVNDSAFEQMHRRVMRDRVAESVIEFYPDHDRWYEVRSYPAVNGITMYFRNVTEKIQAETALRESEEKTRNILESIAEAFFALDENWQFTYMNQSGEALLDRPPGDLIGKNFWQEYPGVRESEFEMVYRKAMEERLPGTLTAFYPDHDRWYEVRTYPAANGIAVYFSDVTAQIQAEAALKASNTRLKLLSEVANDLLLNEDPKAFLASLFAKVSTFLGLEIYFNYLFDEDQQRLQLNTYGGISEEIAKSAEILELGQGICGYAVQYRQSAIVENALESDDSLAIPTQSLGIRAYASHPLIVGDRVLGTLGFGTRQRNSFTPDELDLMQAVANQIAVALDRSRLVAELQNRAEGLAQANRIKDEFLAVLSHELRSPLNPILGWTRLMQSGKLDPARQTAALATIERNAKLQSQLIEDLLDISRIMQGKLTLTAAPTSLSFVISAAVETVSLAIEAKNIQITLDLDPDIALISGDAARLQQVVWNLLTNAVKFTPNEGRVTVELRQVESNQGSLGNPIAQIRVIDTGKGISPQFLPYVFEYFRQEDGSTTRRFGGLGLGLAIVRQIVELHGGSVKVESEGEDQGATFTVQLPTLKQATLSAPKPISAPADSETRLNGIQILLVDDDTDTREFQTFLLEQNGATVIAAASGLEALKAMESIPDVVVSDIGMAEMDGYMLIQQIRSRPLAEGGTIPAIALTAYAAEIDQKRAMQAGFQMHLTKPLEPEQFVSAILSVLKR